jgi:hypothetical protein
MLMKNPQLKMEKKHMKKTRDSTRDAEKKHLDRLCDELGEDTIQKLHKAFELTAGALYKRAKQRAEAELQKDKQ